MSSQPEWTFNDGWVLMSVYLMHGQDGASLTDLIAAADAMNHAIPTSGELTRALTRLAKCDVVRHTEGRYRITPKYLPAIAAAHEKKGGLFANPEKGKKWLLATDERTALNVVDPEFMAGLVFAGANEAPDSDVDDGILTAAEIATLDLTETEMAVLSACETASGRFANGEGVLGLQRAFHVAGVETVVASLWQVDDRSTRDLMVAFNGNLWHESERSPSKLEALRQSQLWMLGDDKSSLLESARRSLQRGGKTRGAEVLIEKFESLPGHRLPPYYWGAFVLSGDWR